MTKSRFIPFRKNKNAFLSNLPSASLKDLFLSRYLICTAKRSFKSTAANRKNAPFFFRNGIIYFEDLYSSEKNYTETQNGIVLAVKIIPGAGKREVDVLSMVKIQ